jgi:hypothetical protein
VGLLTQRGAILQAEEPWNFRRLFSTGLLVWLIYTILLSLLIHRHEPWFDEAQAWLLARDATFPDLLLHRLRYEGSPGLWHCLLALLAKSGLPFSSMSWVAGLLGSGSVLILIFHAPFPTWIRYTLPFTFFFFYQYAVVARSYVLLPLILFCIARIYWDASDRLITFTVLLILLANVSVHGALLSGAIVASTLWRLLPRWRLLGSEQKRNHGIAFVLYSLAAGSLVLQLHKPPDLTDFGTLNLGIKHLISVAAIDLKNAFTCSFILSGLLLSVSVRWFYRQSTLLLFLFGTAAVCALGAVVYSNVWHEGVLLCWWVFVMWLSWNPPLVRMPRLVLSTWMVLITIQFVWAFCTGWFDWRFPYSGSQAVARYLSEQHLQEEKVYAFGWKNAAILPYFQRDIFANWPRNYSYWLWSSRNTVNSSFSEVSAVHPQFVVLAISNEGASETISQRKLLTDLNYRLTRRFDGALYWKAWILELDSYEVYQPATPEPLLTDKSDSEWVRRGVR